MSKKKLFSLVLFISLFFSCADKIQQKKIEAKKGVIDLRDFDFEKEIINLDGAWEFYPDEFLEIKKLEIAKEKFELGQEFDLLLNEVLSIDLSIETENKKKEFIEVPGVWTKVYKKRFGYGTYRLVIKLPKIIPKSLIFKIPELGTAYDFYLNGLKIVSNGKVGKRREDSVPELRPTLSPIIYATNEMEIIIHLSNFHNRDGGLWYSIQFGKESLIRDLKESKMYNTLFIYGSLFTMVIYHLVIFLIRYKDKSALVFSFFCLCIFFQLLVNDEKLLNQKFRDGTYLLFSRIEYLSYYLALPCFSHFLQLVFPKDFNIKFRKTIWIISGLFCLFVLFTPSEIYTFSTPIYHIYTLICLCYLLYIFLKAMIQKRNSASIIFIGTVIFFIGIVNDMLYSLTIIQTSFLFPQALLAFLFSHSILISRNFSFALNEIEELSFNLKKINLELEEKVISRTKEYKEQKEIAEEANLIKDKFVSIVSHDLRTPLQGVFNLLEILGNRKIPKTDEESKSFLKMCKENIELSLKMIKELLDIGKLKSGNLKVEKVEIELKELLDSIKIELMPLFIQKNISLISNIQTSVKIYADKNFLRQVLNNLIVNAIKFSEKFTEIKIYHKTEQNDFYLYIKDHGIGMSEEKLSSLFSSENFKNSIGTRGELGSGMGLFICKYLLQIQGGSLILESEVGVGTNCEIKLPLK